MKILTGAQHTELDRYTIENKPIESIDLMENASMAIALEIMARWDNHRTIYVFAGPGNNGGDGLAVARLLLRQGYKVFVLLFNIKGKLSEDCEINRSRLMEMLGNEQYTSRITFKEITQGFDFPHIQQHDVVVDALFGTGIKQPLSGGFAVVARKINSLHAHVVSVDIPSGLFCEDNSYTDRSVVIHAELTLTMGLPKLAFLMADNEQCVGEWKVLDIGLSEEGINQMNTPYSIIEEKDVRELVHKRSAFAHKGSLGHALLVAGSYGMAGAAILSSKACLHSGIGKLTLHTPSANNTILQVSVPEAVLAPDADKTCITEAIDTSRYKAIGIGPGLGRDERTAEALQQYLCISSSPSVIDADALNILGDHGEMMSQIPSGSILTPHVKELENMTGQAANCYDRLQKAIELATHRNVYVILKGHYTAICTPSGKTLFCPLGNSGMATAGSGDVLTGLLTGLLAQGYSPIEACILGVWLHASAGDMAAEELTPEFMLAGDIIASLSKAWKKIK